MWCAACANETAAIPCSACESDPLVDGRYRLFAVLGRGAQGTTWHAFREADGVAFAIKELLLRPGLAPKVVELARREALVLSQLDHAAIPTYIESFETGVGRGRSLWIVQEFVAGQTLADEALTRRYSEAEVMEIVTELAAVLDWLHTRSPPVVHRDLKPRNVLRRTNGSLALADFGSVKEALGDADFGGSTVAGTFGYMAPEQFAGDASPASDLYALGALAVALLTRREPHTLLRGRDLAWRAHASVSTATAQVIDGLLESNPDRRRLRLHTPVPDPSDLPPSPDLAWKPAPTSTMPQIPQLPMTPLPASFPQRHKIGSVLALSGALVAGLLLLFVASDEKPATAWPSRRVPAPVAEAPRQAQPTPLQFGEDGWSLSGGGRYVYGVYSDGDMTLDGQPTWMLAPAAYTANTYGTWMRAVSAEPYAGKRVRLSIITRTRGTTARADFWARVQGINSPGDGRGLGGDSESLPAESDWVLRELEIDVPEDGVSIQYGVGIAGPGTMWFAQPAIEIVDGGAMVAKGI